MLAVGTEIHILWGMVGLIIIIIKEWLEIRLRLQAIHMYKYTKLQGPRFQRNYIIAGDQKSDLHDMSLQSSLKINYMHITRPFAYNESLQNPSIAGLLIKIFFFGHSVVFICSKVIIYFK